MLSCDDFNGFCPKWDLVLKIKPWALYKLTASAGLSLADPRKQRKFVSATATRHCSDKSSKHILKMQHVILH